MQATASEKLVSRIWQHQLTTNLVTDDGAHIQIIHPGRPSNGSGCDFKDAVLNIEGIVITGDIEIHVKSSQWYQHGHHLNTNYNDIVLHVTLWQDSPSPTILENGRIIPTVCLSRFLDDDCIRLNEQINQLCHQSPSCPHIVPHSNNDSLRDLLDIAGQERFTAKMALFKTSLEKEDAGQVLFRGIARALGYSQNTEPCDKLASRIHLSLLEKVTPDTCISKQALILGTAGLLPSQRLRLHNVAVMDNETEDLEKSWRTSGITETMNEADWCFSRVRPDNFPTRRLAALGFILDRYARTGLLRGTLNLIEEAPQGTERRWLENGFMIAGQSYWAHHLDFGIAKRTNSALIGQEKAAEIIINIVLPFAYAQGELADEPGLKKKAAAIYRHYPRLGDNELTRYMKQQLRIGQNHTISASLQQGLIHIFKNNCRYRNCSTCVVALNRN